jgi:ABC-type polysaccharide/polyol phosphate export permease
VTLNQADNATTYISSEQRQVRRVVRDLIRGRELLLGLVWKDLRARYRYAVMGFLWAVLEPLALMAILTFVFTFVFAGRADGIGGGEGPPYAIMLLCGLIFWQYFAAAISSATLSLVDHQNLVKKVYFPREVVPLASVCFPLVNLGIGLLTLLILHVAFGGTLGFGLLWFPVVFSLQFTMMVGLALLLSCGHVLFRDVGNMVQVAIMFGFYASPVFYPLDFVRQAAERGVVPSWMYALYLLNPMAGLLTAYRQVLFELRFPDLALLVWPGLVALAVLALGVVSFRRSAPTLSDHL